MRRILSRIVSLSLIGIMTVSMGACGKSEVVVPVEEEQVSVEPEIENTNSVVEEKEIESEEYTMNEFKIEQAAYDSFSSFIDEYYFHSKIKEYGLFLKLNYWDQAEIYEVVIDAYEHTGDERYLKMIYEIYDGFVMTHGEDWTWNEFNDDIMWMTIACTRAYFATGDEKFLKTAIKHFDIVWNRGWSDDLGGGIFWRIENQTKNACINCPATIAACLLGEATGDEKYYDKAVMIENWVVENIYEEDTGHVYDAYEMNGRKNQWASTYNQGTFIGANTLLYLHYKDGIYLSRARAAADYTIEKMYNNGIMNNEENGGDLIGFKGILARWMYCFAMNCNQPDVLEWMEENAKSAWDNRNDKGIMTTQFARKTRDDEKVMPFSASSAVSILNNCRTNKVILKTLDEAIDLLDFTRCERILTQKEDKENKFTAVSNEAYAVYTCVKFSEGDDKIKLKVRADEDVDIEIRIDKYDGSVISKGTIKASDNIEENIFSIDATDLKGRHNLYVVILNKDNSIYF